MRGIRARPTDTSMSGVKFVEQARSQEAQIELRILFRAGGE